MAIPARHFWPHESRPSGTWFVLAATIAGSLARLIFEICEKKRLIPE